MKLRIKNGLTLSLVRMIDSTKEKGGIPDYIYVTTSEAKSLLDEMIICRDRYDITMLPASVPIDVLVLSTDKAKDEFIEKWTFDTYIVTFKHDKECLVIKIVDEAASQTS